MAMAPRAVRRFEWPTVFMVISAYALWGLGTTWLAGVSLPLAMIAVTLGAALHSSLTHEMLHGHPFANRHLNAALVFPALSVVVPYMRFRDTHLAHHQDSILTDPYDDPESNYLDPAVWARLAPWHRMVLRANNTLAGRLLIGPLVGQIAFMAGDARLILRGDGRALAGWLWHVPAVALVVAWMIWIAEMPLWAWALSTYAALAVLKIRTFLEHQAHEKARGRTVIIEDRGPLAVIFLNNNLHVVHHMHPRVPWYRLPALYRENRARYLSRNENYLFRSYAEVFRRYFWRAKDPVPHPLWPKP